MTVVQQRCGNETGLWDQVLASIGRSLSPACFDTWFRPVRCAGMDQNVLHLSVPNETFRRFLLDNYSELLRQAVMKVSGDHFELRIAVDDAAERSPAAPDSPTTAVPLPVVRASALQTALHPRSWMVEQLWTDSAVGVIGGSPKSGKTWLALDMAVSVASGTPCLGAFPVQAPGPVLLYAAEDSSTALRARLETLARLRNLDFERLEVRVITADSLRLDRPDDQGRLEATLAAHQPVLLVLDPLIRVHAIDENVSGQEAALLGYLRGLQRRTGAAIALVHHVRKNVSPAAGAGYSLRGSSDLYAWLDSFLYLRKHQDQLSLSAEHRSAPPFGPVALQLAQSHPAGTHLRILSLDRTGAAPIQDTLETRILDLLSSSAEPLTVDSLRARLQVRNQRVVEALHQLSSQRKVQRLARGYALRVDGDQLPRPLS